jgi:division/cell wall cluster transcriptional repressor MraZ
METPPYPNMSTDPTISVHFFGSEYYTLDQKGRVTVPVDWRNPDDESEVFYLVPDSKGECLRAMHHERYVQFGVTARNLPGMDEQKHRMFMRNFYAQCAKTTTDKQGRISIPKTYCDRFQLDGEIVLHGTGDLFEIWNKSAHAARQKTEAPDYAKIAGAMGL